MTKRRAAGVAGLAGAGLAATVAAGVVAQRLLVRRVRDRADPAVTDALDRIARVGDETPAWVRTSDGARLRVVVRGEGIPVVLVHGVALSSLCWHYQLEDLSGGARVIAYDQRGHGDSTIGSDGLTLSRLAADLAEVLEQLDVRGGVLVGHSLGGMVAMRMLADRPALAAAGGRIAGLALVATSASPAVGSGVPGARALLRAAQPVTARGAWLASRLPGHTLPDSDLSFLLARVVFGSGPEAAHVDLTREITSRIPMQVSAELLLEIIQLDQEATLSAIAVPTVIVVGTRDLMTPVRHARALARAIPSASLVELEGCGHMVMLERRKELSGVLEDLIEAVGPAPAVTAG